MYKYTTQVGAVFLIGTALTLGGTGCGSESTPTIDNLEMPHLETQRVVGPLNAFLVAEQQKLVAKNGVAGAHFGCSVALSGDTAIVGANQDQGSAYIFVRNGSTWNQQAELTASDGAPDGQFGISVSLSGDTALVGAVHNSGMNGIEGAAYVFTRENNLWTEQAKLMANDAVAPNNCGISVAISQDTAIVGCREAAYVFYRSGSIWEQQAKLIPSDALPFAWFGASVSLAGERAIVGAIWDDHNGVNSGSAYIFARNGATWTQEDKLVANDGVANDLFAFSVSLSPDAAVVGSIRNMSHGAAYVFLRNGTTWVQQSKLVPSDGAATDYFGHSVSVSEDGILVGSMLGDGANSNQGSAYVYGRTGTEWREEAKLVASDGNSMDGFGTSVFLSQNTALVGASTTDPSGTMDQGAAYTFLLGKTCANMPDGTSCDDNNVCTQIDTCQLGACVGANPIFCVPDVCQESQCNPATGFCMTWPLPDQTPCPGGECIAGGCYVDNVLLSTGSGGAGGIDNSVGMGGSSSTSNSGSSSTTSGFGGNANGSANEPGVPRSLVFKGSGCSCNAVQSGSMGERWLLLGSIGLLAARRRSISRS